ncbi:CHAT domain-containing tetratricopeptide repeat protein [Hyalangium sp.]|uniref:CHAT domain-containing tetratricopeptide repeat protein n=1 Tax=Hyalangium sp. TaxID=2028555 RepID=UPI002D6AE6EF|nr:CHAT domain-containing tetratricopeptide repeat protein [Hyalangium sp.]HYI00656.1 CHAT domain-containing tetratricopeptide repeat protein [Hyalangium sp.]
MRLVLGWIGVVVVCCAAGAAAGEESPDARLQEAQKAYDKAIALYQAGKYAEAVTLGEHALVLREAVLGGTHPAVANCLNLLGHLRQLQGDFERAEPLLQRTHALRESALGKNHPTVADSLHNLALLYAAQGLYGRAEPLYVRALAISEAALGNNHPTVAASLNNLAALYHEQGLYGRAEPLYKRALTLREAALGNNHPTVATSLLNLAILYQAQGLYDRAEPLFERALAILEAALGKNHPHVAQSLLGLAALYAAQGLYGQAEPLFERALAISEVALGNNHPTVATSLNHLADLYQEQGLYGRAEPLYKRARAISEAAFDKNHPDVAASLNSLAALYAKQGLYGRAEPLFKRVLALREAALGNNHPDVATSLNNLAALYDGQGLYGRAEPLYVRALALREAAFTKNHPTVAESLNNLGALYWAQGLYGRAELLFERAIAIREVVLGKNHPQIAESLYNLALLYQEQGLYGRAEPLYVRALAISEAALGNNHPNVAESLNNLAALYQAQGLYGQAEPIFERALTIREVALGNNHPHVALSLHNLATLYLAQGLYGRAEPLYKRARAISEAALGKNHPHVAQSLNNLALLRLAQHRLGSALPLFTRAFAISEQRLRQEALDFSEARLASFLQLLRTNEELLYSLLREHPDNASVRRLALSAALLLKGRSVEETANISRAVYRSLGTEERDTFERLRGLRTRLAQLSLQGPGSLPPTVYQQRLKELADQGNALEATLARRSAPLRALAALPAPADIVGRVAAALPKDGALVEFITYEDRPLVPKPGAPEPQLRYLALVLLPDATIRTRDLGPAESIDLAAWRLRDALANKDAAFQSQAQALYQLAFQPLQPLVGKTRRLFLSPDGQLALVPFAALHDGRRFLVETFDFTYLTSGKDLLPRPQKTLPAASVVVLADPDFSASLQAPVPYLGDASARAERSPSIERFFSALRGGPTHRAWNPVPLPGTRQEAEAIQRLLPQAQLFLGPEATKERLLHLPTPSILHLATHGVFLDDAPAPTRSRAVGHFGALGEEPLASRPPDPLLRSGLLFAGASALTPSTSSAPQSQPDSALATALELAGLNLWGTQLVVLSACDTGRGDIKLGQGVYGLRRAFVVAGAETVVMSLWKVNDETTRTLMEAYYRNLLAGQGRATALREAMRSLRATQPHPHYWAPFIVLGRDAPLRALTPTPQEVQKK